MKANVSSISSIKDNTDRGGRRGGGGMWEAFRGTQKLNGAWDSAQKLMMKFRHSEGRHACLFIAMYR